MAASQPNRPWVRVSPSGNASRAIMRHLALSFLTSVLLVAASAQNTPILRTESALRQSESIRQRQAFAPQFRTAAATGQTAPELYPGESADVGPQYLLLQQRPAERRTWWEGAVDVQYFYTSNMFLTEKGNTDTGLLISTAYAAFAPPPIALWGGELSFRAGYRHQRYMYGLDDTSNQLNNFDFDVGTVFLSARYKFREDWSAFLGVEYNRLLAHEDGWHEFYTELLPVWGLERQIPINDHHAVSLAYVGGYHLTHADPNPTTNINDRVDSILSITWSWQIVPRVVLQPYYRFQQTHYWENSDRNDIFHTLGASIAWFLTDWASVRVFSNWELRDSNDEFVQDYEKFDTGGGLSLSVRF